jgi:hypothetical protein
LKIVLNRIAVESWDDETAKEAEMREPLLESLAPKRKKMDEYDMDYDKGASKKKKVKRDLFSNSVNQFQQKANKVSVTSVSQTECLNTHFVYSNNRTNN